MNIKNLIEEYVETLQIIAEYKDGDEFEPTPYAFETKRADIHDRLWNELGSHLEFDAKFTYSDGYCRSKEIFANLDKVFALYNNIPLDLTNTGHVQILSKNLNDFLQKTETKLFLEGKARNIPGIVEYL